jgi:hypothetical protein
VVRWNVEGRFQIDFWLGCCCYLFGVDGLWSGFFHIAYPEHAAYFIGWQDSPFQFEVGMADLAFGVAGCAAFRASHGFKAPTVLVNAIFLLGDAAGHVRQMMTTGTFASGNAGPVFYLDILLLVATIVLLLISRHIAKPAGSVCLVAVSQKVIDVAFEVDGPRRTGALIRA